MQIPKIVDVIIFTPLTLSLFLGGIYWRRAGRLVRGVNPRKQTSEKEGDDVLGDSRTGPVFDATAALSELGGRWAPADMVGETDGRADAMADATFDRETAAVEAALRAVRAPEFSGGQSGATLSGSLEEGVDWRHEVPRQVREAWDELSFERRLLHYIAARRAAARRRQ